MNTFNQQKQRALEEFLDFLEQVETADDVPVSEIEAGEVAHPSIQRRTRFW